MRGFRGYIMIVCLFLHWGLYNVRAVVGLLLGITATLTVCGFQPAQAEPALEKLVVKQLKRKDFQGAKETAEKILQTTPSSIAAHAWLARALYGLKDYQHAADECTKAMDDSLDPKDKERLRFDRAQAEYFGQQYDEAIADFSALIQRAPTEDLYLQRASAYDAAGKPELAIQDLSDAIKLNPNSHEIWLKRALLHKHMKRNDKALNDFNEAINLNPSLATWRASFYRDQGQHKEAIQDFTTAIAANKGCGKAAELCNRALVYADLDHHRKAIKDLDAAIKLEPKRHAYYANRAVSYYGVSDFKRSIEDLSEAIKQAPKNPEYYFKRAEAETSDGQKESALKDYDEAIKLQADKREAAQYSYRRAIVAAELGKHEQALQDLSRAIESDATESDYWFNRGLEYKSLSQWKEAEADFSKAIELRSTRGTTYKHRATVRAKLGDNAGAIADLNTSMQIYGDQKDMFGMAEVRRMMAKLSKN